MVLRSFNIYLKNPKMNIWINSSFEETFEVMLGNYFDNAPNVFVTCSLKISRIIQCIYICIYMYTYVNISKFNDKKCEQVVTDLLYTLGT